MLYYKASTKALFTQAGQASSGGRPPVLGDAWNFKLWTGRWGIMSVKALE
jgi:hypothetical protein